MGLRKVVPSVIILLSAIISVSVAKKIEKYDRKSISIFKTDIKTEAKPNISNKYANEIHEGLYNKFKYLRRFDYNPIPVGVSNPDELFKIVKEYAATKIDERASKQWNIRNDYYGTNFVSSDHVDKIMNGTYILFPSIDKFEINYINIELTISIKIYSGINTGSIEEPNWAPNFIKTVSIAVSKKIGNGSAINIPFLFKRTPEDQAVSGAIDKILILLERELNKIDQFKIKALVTEAKPTKDIIKFNFGENIGINLDDSYQIGYYQKDKNGNQKFVETGYMKVRDIDKEESIGQLLLVTNKFAEKEDDLFNEYDQVIEYPLVGFNIQFGGGFGSFKSFDGVTEDGSMFKETSMAVSFGTEFQYNIARFIKISEFYTNISVDYLFASAKKELFGTTVDYDLTVFVNEIGFKKKFYLRNFVPYFGVNFAIEVIKISYDNFGNILDDSEVDLTSIGVTTNIGFNYILSKMAYIDVSTGWKNFSEVIDKDGVKWFDETGEDEGFWTPSGWFIKAGIGLTL